MNTYTAKMAQFNAHTSPGKASDRVLFDAAVELYDAVRPGYPEELVEAVINLGKLPDGGHVLEVGCGTGQATLPFAERGYRLTCLDIGEQMITFAKQKFQDFPNVTFEQTAFENYQTTQTFDLVLSATAWHWLPPETAYNKAASLLADTGHLAILSNLHPKPYTGFHRTAQSIYNTFFPATDADARSTEAGIQAATATLDATGLFEPTQVRTHAWRKTYTAEAYLKLLETYSDVRRLGDNTRRDFLNAIARHINEDYGGAVERPYLSVLLLAKKR